MSRSFPEPATQQMRAASRPYPEYSAWVFIALSFLFDLVLIASTRLDLAPDETHYWEWSRRLDLAYYSKGPLIAYVIRASCTVFGDTMFGVRFPAALSQTLFLAVFYLFARELHGNSAAYRLLLLVRSSLIISSCGLVMTTDPLALLFWTGALFVAWRALANEGPWRWWMFFGALAGIGFLAKYTTAAIVVITGALLCARRDLRPHLRPFIIAVVVFALSVAPVIVWNSQNGWVNFAHNATHLAPGATGSGLRFRPHYLAELIAGQWGLVGPVLLPALFVAAWNRRGHEGVRLLSWSAFALLGVCASVALFKNVYANWPLPAYVGLALAAAPRVVVPESVVWRRWALALQLGLFIFAHTVYLGMTYGIPPRLLPTNKLAGWSELGRAVGSVRGDRFVIAENYDSASELAFYVAGQEEVMCAVVDDRRMNQYDVWGGWERLAGRDALLVVKDVGSAEKLAPRFRKLTYAGEVPIHFGGTLIRNYSLYFADGYDGVPPPFPIRR